MTFQPFVVGSGLPAWSLLKSTLTTQKAAFGASYQTQSDTQYFRNAFPGLDSPEAIVNDRRVFRVVLGAYGLADDIDNRHFIKTVLSEGVTDRSALANRLSDRRYRAMARDFDFSVVPPAHKAKPGLMNQTVQNYLAQAFEAKIGETDADMRLALGFARQLAEVGTSAGSNNAAWFQVLATPPLREVLQTALGLPSAFAQLDIDDQHARIMDKAKRVFGTDAVNELAQEERSEDLVRRFLVSRQAETSRENSSLQTALVLLSAIPKRT
jgi:hypothetical protein